MSLDCSSERATKLGYQIEYADPEYDTHGIAAITGPTGALLYLVDSNDPSPHWEREFNYHSVDQTHIYPEWII